MMPPRRDIISRIHADLRAARFTRRGATLPAEEVPQFTHKEYPRMPRIALPEPKLESSLQDIFKKRISFVGGAVGSAITLQDAANLLGGLRAREDGHRPHPSGGALYPIETYVLGSVGDHKNAVFHYHPKTHALEHLWQLPASFDTSDLFADSTPPIPWSSTIILFTAVWCRSSAKYGDFTYTVALMEAGHMAQNVLLAAAASSVRSRPVAGCNDSLVHNLLDLDGENEQVVYTIALYPQA